MLSNSRPPRFDISACARRVADTAGRLFAAALPQHCALCAAPSGASLLCAACEASLPLVGESCPACALPVPGGALCGRCVRRPPPQALTVAAHAYAFPADRLVMRLKYGHELPLAGALAARLASSLPARYAPGSWPDAIVPLPLARRRQRERGFNQACEIARPLAKTLGRPLLHALVRDRDAPPQASLPRSRRASNVRGAFRACHDVRGLSVALVDDVMTTGATVDAAARALRSAGARSVDAWVVARALPGAHG